MGYQQHLFTEVERGNEKEKRLHQEYNTLILARGPFLESPGNSLGPQSYFVNRYLKREKYTVNIAITIFSKVFSDLLQCVLVVAETRIVCLYDKNHSVGVFGERQGSFWRGIRLLICFCFVIISPDFFSCTNS